MRQPSHTEAAPGGAVDRDADRLVPIVYDELRALAARLLRSERPGHTLQTTALVHEAYLRLAARNQLGDCGPTRFKAVAARAMAKVLIDHARVRNAAKRGGPHRRSICLSEAAEALKIPDVDLSHVSEALARLSALDARKASVVELRFFGGLSNAEIAESLGVSPTTVEGDWRMARAWLRCEIIRMGAS